MCYRVLDSMARLNRLRDFYPTIHLWGKVYLVRHRPYRVAGRFRFAFWSIYVVKESHNGREP